jgi:hypothetical protein
MIAKKDRDWDRGVEEKNHLKLPEMRQISFSPDCFDRFVNIGDR